MTSPRDQVLAKCGFDEKAVEAKWAELRREYEVSQEDFITPGYNAYEAIVDLARWQSERDMKVITALLDLAQRQNEALGNLPISRAHNVKFYDADNDGVCHDHCPGCAAMKAIADFNKTLSEISGE